MLLLFFACSSLTDLTEDGQLYTAWSIEPTDAPCGELGGLERFCDRGVCVDANARTCHAPRLCDVPLAAYDGVAGDFCSENVSCVRGDYCDPRGPGCIATQGACYGDDVIDD